MNDRSPFCAVCDLPVMPGAPIDLCQSCITKTYRFAEACLRTVKPARCELCRDAAIGDPVCLCAECLRAAFLRPRKQDTLRFRMPPRPDPVGYVYYLRMGDEIKIGHSVDPCERARSLSLTPNHLLATERGGTSLEKTRHRQFADERLHGEWFVPSDALLAHIAAIVRKHGEPFRGNRREWLDSLATEAS